jgi:hypothetical protein
MLTLTSVCTPNPLGSGNNSFSYCIMSYLSKTGRPIKVTDMIQTPSDTWVITINGDLLRVMNDEVETLTVPLPHALIEDRPQEKTLRFTGKVRAITLKEDKPDSISFKLAMDLEFRNASDMPVYILDGSAVMKDWNYVVSGGALAYSPDAAIKRDYFFNDSGMWPNNYRGPDYLAFRDCLDTPAPSGKCLRLLAPGESFRFTAEQFLSIGKKRPLSIPSDWKSWEEINVSKPLWLQVVVESWPINLDYDYALNIQARKYDVFNLMLQRRWLKYGLLPPHRMRSEPMSLDLSPWACNPTALVCSTHSLTLSR